MAEPTQGRVIITVDDEHLGQIDKLASELRSAGVTVTNVMNTVGIISGEVSEEALEAVRAVSGVKAVEPERQMRAL
jgi:hypothetical protein